MNYIAEEIERYNKQEVQFETTEVVDVKHIKLVVVPHVPSPSTLMHLVVAGGLPPQGYLDIGYVCSGDFFQLFSFELGGVEKDSEIRTVYFEGNKPTQVYVNAPKQGKEYVSPFNEEQLRNTAAFRMLIELLHDDEEIKPTLEELLSK